MSIFHEPLRLSWISSLAAIDADLKKVFRDVIPVLRGSLDFISEVDTHVDRVRLVNAITLSVAKME